MNQIFISYSRKDVDFARQVVDQFTAKGMGVWVDWEDIPPSVDWMTQIQKGIEEANIFIFIVSPESAVSEVCRDEFGHALKNGKRLIPVIRRDVEPDHVPNAIKSLNWIFAREQDNLAVAFEKLFESITINYDWVEQHRRLQVKALEWERNHTDNAYLLRGRDLQEAETTIAMNSGKDPRPTPLQHQYLLASRKLTEKQRRTITLLSVVAAVVTLSLAIFGFYQAGIAKRTATIARSGELAAQSRLASQTSRQTAALLSIEAVSNLQENNIKQIPVTVQSAMFDALSDLGGAPLSGLPKNNVFIFSRMAAASGASTTFSADKRWLAAYNMDNIIRVWDTSQPNDSPILLKPDRADIFSIAITNDGKRVVASCLDFTILIWDTESPDKPVRIIEEEASGPDSVPFFTLSKNGSWLIMQNKLWDLADPQIPPTQLIDDNSDSLAFYSLSFSADENWLAYSGILWSLVDDKPVRVISLGEQDAQFVFSSDSKKIFTASGVWNLENDIPVKIKDFPALDSAGLSVSPNDRWVILYGLDQVTQAVNVLAWDAEHPKNPLISIPLNDTISAQNNSINTGYKSSASYRPENRFGGTPYGPLQNIYFSSDSRWLLLGYSLSSADGQTLSYLNLVDMKNPTDPSFRLGGENSLVLDGSFSLSSNWLTVRYTNFTNTPYKYSYKFIDLTNPEKATKEINGLDGNVYAVNSEDVFVATNSDGQILKVDLNQAKVEDYSTPLMLGKGGAINEIHFIPAANKFITVSDGVYLWDLDENIGLPGLFSNDIFLGFLNENSLVTGSSNAGNVTLKIWDIQNLTSKETLIHQSAAVYDAKVSADKKWVAMTLSDGSFYLISVSGVVSPYLLEEKHELDELESNKVFFSQDGKYLVKANFQYFSTVKSSLLIWNLNDLGSPPKDMSDINTGTIVDMSNDMRWLVAESINEDANTSTNNMLWDLNNPQATPITLNPVDYVGYSFNFAFDPKNHWLAYDVSNSDDQIGQIGVRDLSTPSNAPILLGENNTPIHFSEDGQWLISKDAIWSAEDFRLQPIKIDGQSNIDISKDGKYLITLGGDQNLYIWNFPGDLSSPAMSFKNPDSGLSFIFSPDNQFLIGHYGDNTPYIYLWELNMEKLHARACDYVSTNFTTAEWKQFFPNEAYRSTCDQLPVMP